MTWLSGISVDKKATTKNQNFIIFVVPDAKIKNKNKKQKPHI